MSLTPKTNGHEHAHPHLPRGFVKRSCGDYNEGPMVEDQLGTSIPISPLRCSPTLVIVRLKTSLRRLPIA